MTTCTATTRLTLSPFDRDHPDVRCLRDVDDTGRHVGKHQGLDHQPGYDRLVTWDEGGAHSCSYDPAVPTTNCMCVRAAASGDDRTLDRLGHRPEDHRWNACSTCGIIHDTTAPGNASCSSCSLWAGRAETYARQRREPDTRRGMSGRWSRQIRPHGDTFAGHPRLYTWSHGLSGAFGGLQVTVTWDDGDSAGPGDYLWDSGQIPWWLVDRFPPNSTIDRHQKIPRPGHTTPSGLPLDYTGHP